MKVSIIGAGSVGATAAMRIAERGIADVALLDIAGNVARGKALDLNHALCFTRSTKNITGTDDYRRIKGSDICVVCAGFSRRPGMSREDLLLKNAHVVKEVISNIKRYAPSSVIIMVTNPLDLMTYLAYKMSGFPKKRIIGMAGVLDSARFIRIIADELKVRASDVKTMIIGVHSDAMVPLLNYTTVRGRRIKDLVSKARISRLAEETRAAGSRVVSLLGTGSAYFAPSASIAATVECILKNKGRVLPSSCYLAGEYGLNDICMGVPARIGRNGIQDILELRLTEEERAALNASAEKLRQDLNSLGGMIG